MKQSIGALNQIRPAVGKGEGKMREKMKYGAILLGIWLATTLLCGGCAEKKEEPKKMQTTADKALPDEGYKGKISVENAPASMKVNASANIKVKIRNMGSHVWPTKGLPDGKFKVNVTYRWLDKDNRIVIPDGLRTGLPHDVNPNEEIALEVQVAAPNQAGDYILELSIVQEGVAWFQEKGNETTKIPVKVE
jgi:hypothetical protein